MWFLWSYFGMMIYADFRLNYREFCKRFKAFTRLHNGPVNMQILCEMFTETLLNNLKFDYFHVETELLLAVNGCRSLCVRPVMVGNLSRCTPPMVQSQLESSPMPPFKG